MNNGIGKLVSLHPCVPMPPTAVSRGSLTQVGHEAHPQQGVPIVDYHDRVISGEGHCIALI
jgi:hypothetical protein